MLLLQNTFKIIKKRKFYEKTTLFPLSILAILTMAGCSNSKSPDEQFDPDLDPACGIVDGGTQIYGIDSNGSFKMTGGFVVTRGAPNNADRMSTGLDCDGTASISGGTLIAFNGLEKLQVDLLRSCTLIMEPLNKAVMAVKVLQAVNLLKASIP